ncbi:MAG: HlyD family efflux transporter periplasmic adaptor subunit [Acidiferrobacterales bacterium]|nr:HlyD family efflux transporter periplasmic adaptor subunit [Acidiferrobacterales bacterium]
MKRFLKFLLPLLILAAGIGGYLYLKQTKPEIESVASKATLPVVAAQRIAKSAIAPGLTLFGQIEAPRNTVLTAGIAADVLAVNVLEGDIAVKDQPLVLLDQADINLDILQRQAEVVEIEAQLESDRSRFEADKEALKREKQLVALSNKAVERASTLARSSAGTEATLDDALQQVQQLLLAVTQRELAIADFESRQKLWRARLEKAKAVLARSKRDLERTAVRAPFDGRVIDVMVSPGDRAGSTTQLVRIYDDTALEIRAQVPSRYVPVLRNAIADKQSVKAVMIDNAREIPLTLVRLAASVVQGQGGVDAFFRAAPGSLPALGKTVELQLELPAIANAVALSPEALYGSNLVYRIIDGALKAQSVERLGQTLGGPNGGRMLVRGDVFDTGDLVLDSRLPQAIDGLRVTIEGEPE